MSDRCKAMMQFGAWYQAPVKHCRYPAQPNGYCRIHDPAKRLATLKRRKKLLIERLAKVEAELLTFSPNAADREQARKEAVP